jgi:hypothetical protein
MEIALRHETAEAIRVRQPEPADAQLSDQPEPDYEMIEWVEAAR